MRSLFAALAAVLFAAMAHAQPSPGLLKAQDTATNAQISAGRLSFGMDMTDLTFVADMSGVADPKAILKILTDSAEATDGVTIWFDPETARVDRVSFSPTVVVRAIEFQGKVYPVDEKTKPLAPDAKTVPQEAATFDLVRGAAYALGHQHDKALVLLDRALNSLAFPGGLQVWAHSIRAHVREDTAITYVEPGPERDRLMFGALEDARIVRNALPVLSGPAYQVARDWKILGAYGEAEEVYLDALRRWPEQPKQALMGLTMLYRTMGQYDKALTWSDKWGALPDAKDGMPYHYHRGWILDLMGRHDEAIAELTAGMKFQTDFAGAYWRCSCAYAAEGHIAEALADNGKALALQQEELAGIRPTAYAVAMVKRFGEVNAALKKVLAEAPTTKLAGQCDGFWDWGDNYRARSALLPRR